MQLWVWSQAREPLCSLNLFDTFWNSQDTMVANKTLQAPVKSAVEWHMPHTEFIPHAAYLFQSCFCSSCHDIVLVIPCAHTFEHFIEATFGIKIATTPHLTGLESETYSLVMWSQKMSFIYLPSTVRQVISIISNQLMSCEWMDFSEKSWTTNTSTLRDFLPGGFNLFFKIVKLDHFPKPRVQIKHTHLKFNRLPLKKWCFFHVPSFWDPIISGAICWKNFQGVFFSNHLPQATALAKDLESLYVPNFPKDPTPFGHKPMNFMSTHDI